MNHEDRIKRINELARKSKESGLTLKEQAEQKKLREEYLAEFRKNMRQHIESVKVIDPTGADVTPEKVKKIQKEKGLHGRS